MNFKNKSKFMSHETVLQSWQQRIKWISGDLVRAHCGSRVSMDPPQAVIQVVIWFRVLRTGDPKMS